MTTHLMMALHLFSKRLTRIQNTQDKNTQACCITYHLFRQQTYLEMLFSSGCNKSLGVLGDCEGVQATQVILKL